MQYRSYSRSKYLPVPAVLLALLLAAPAEAQQRSLSEVIAESMDQAAATNADAPATAVAVGTEAASTTDPHPPANGVPHPIGDDYPVTTTASRHPGTATDPFAGSLGDGLARAVDGLHRLVLPPERLQPIPAADPRMDCTALYNEATRLISLGERHRKGFTDDPRNVAIGAVGLVWPAAYYLWGVTAYAGWYEDNHRREANTRLSEVRRIMADRRCFAPG